MSKTIRYGEVASTMAVRQQKISFNLLTPQPQFDETGQEIPYRPPKLQLQAREVYHLLQPYLQVRLIEQIKAVLPLVLYLVLFQLFILHVPISQASTITLGLLAVIVGLMLFMEGLKHGLMPFGETIGEALPRKLSLYNVLVIIFLLGIGVTFAEPAIGALKTAGKIVDPQHAAFLYILLNQWSEVLVLVIGIGVGLAAVVATLRLIGGWSLKPFIYLSLVPTLGMTVYLMTDSQTSHLIGLAWDCGGVTTGPVTVPLVLALGIGIAEATGKSDEALSGFGIVTLASLFPVLGVLLLGSYVAATVSPELALETSHSLPLVRAWYEQTPMLEIIMGLRAIVPLVIFLSIVLLVILRQRIYQPAVLTYGLVLTLLGMIIFNLGLSYGLAELGNQAGHLVPATFQPITAVQHSPLFQWPVGIVVAFMFAWLLGFGATLAEPALHAVGLTVETLTQGAFKKALLVYAVSFGVAWGMALGVIELIFALPLPYFLLPGYFLAVVLTVFSREEYVNIAWDSAGVTTGPVTVPLVLAMGLGFGEAVNAVEGFGILALASIGPVISVLGTGLWIEWQVQRSHSSSI